MAREEKINIGEMGGLLVHPDGADKAAGIVLIQEIFGINANMRALAHWLAGEGFLVCCPDLFWKLEAGVELDDTKPDDLKRAFDLFGRFDVDGGAADVGKALDFLKAHSACSGKVGLIGYCLGGRLAFLGAARSRPEVAVGYYAVGLAALLPEAKTVETPLLLHIAEEDGFVSKDEQAQAKTQLSGHPNISMQFWAGRGHGFARKGGSDYHAADAEKADAQSLAFLQKALK